jgi:heme-degrading monooxygenase HmoA
VRWRTHGEHHDVQQKGRFEVFEDYHLRVGQVTFDSAPPRGVRPEENRFDDTEIGAAKGCTITEVSPSSIAGSGSPPSELLSDLRLDAKAAGLLDHELFESITNPGKLLVLASWRDNSAANDWQPRPFIGAGDVRHRQVRVIRDYGMFDRREAPQFYSDVARTSGR